MRRVVSSGGRVVLGLVCAALAAGCGLGEGKGGDRAGLAAAAVTSASVVAATSAAEAAPTSGAVALDDAHGTVLYGPAGADGRPTVLVAVDGLGADGVLEVRDAAPLLAAGARPGQTLVVSGPVDANVAGATPAAGALTVGRFALDDVQATVRRDPETGVLVDGLTGCAFEPTGPRAAALAEAPDRPLRVTGRLEAVPSTRGPGVRALVVTSARPTTAVTLERCGPRGERSLVAVVDLDGTGAYAVSRAAARKGCAPGAGSLGLRPCGGVCAADAEGRAHGRGLLPEARRAAVAAALAEVDLTGLGAAPPPPEVTLALGGCKAPRATLTIDGAGAPVTVRLGGATSDLPGVGALVAALDAAGDEAPVVRTLARCATSRVEAASARHARTAAELAELWTAHAGTAEGAPEVDFAAARVVGVFLGPPSAAAAEVEVVDVERVGDAVSVLVERRPAGVRAGPCAPASAAPGRTVGAERCASRGPASAQGGPTVAHVVAIDHHPAGRTFAFGVLE